MENHFNITDFIKEFEDNCPIVKRKKFVKGEQIISYSDCQKQLCILVNGIANLVKYDYDGNKFVTERFYSNSIFSDIFFNVNDNIEYMVEAKEQCDVIFFPYKYFSEKCKSNCTFHKKLLEAFPDLILSKIMSLTSRIEILSMKSTREKLIEYFDKLSEQYGKSFTLPFSITELAAMLCVDRSSMSRELTKLKNENLIKQNRNKITILY